ncbi:MAG: hypothetical protein BWY66_02345 [bacterium ADurb.Bin374]|nr:MAG: hypothetical protein BWY66_02345 [bacterium ADurb.Bin374]
MLPEQWGTSFQRRPIRQEGLHHHPCRYISPHIFQTGFVGVNVGNDLESSNIAALRRGDAQHAGVVGTDFSAPGILRTAKPPGGAHRLRDTADAVRRAVGVCGENEPAKPVDEPQFFQTGVRPEGGHDENIAKLRLVSVGKAGRHPIADDIHGVSQPGGIFRPEQQTAGRNVGENRRRARKVGFHLFRRFAKQFARLNREKNRVPCSLPDFDMKGIDGRRGHGPGRGPVRGGEAVVAGFLRMPVVGPKNASDGQPGLAPIGRNGDFPSQSVVDPDTALLVLHSRGEHRSDETEQEHHPCEATRDAVHGLCIHTCA